MSDVLEKLKDDFKNIEDVIFKEQIISNKKIYFIYSEIMVSSVNLNKFVLQNNAYLIDEKKTIDDIYNFFYNVFPAHSVKKIDKYQDAVNGILNGFVIFIYNNECLQIEVRASIDRGIGDAKSEIAIRGSKDSFNENFNTNMGLVKRRLRTTNLKYKACFLGTETKTRTAVLYMDNIVNIDLVDDVDKKLNMINIDGILDSGYIKNIITHDTLLFPTVMTTERPDLVSMSLLEGKIAIIMDNSPYALILPSFFVDFFHTPDDYYQKNVNVSFIRIIRLIAFFISIFLPAYYIAITTHNHDSVSLNMLLNFITQRASVPFPALVEALLMSISFEILRESDMRASSTIGSAVSILGGLILGDALVSAGIISPIMIIVVAISAISGLVFTSVELSSTIRFFRFLLMFLGTFLGIYGLILGLIYLLIKLASINSFGYPYTTPFGPIVISELRDSFIKKEGNEYRKRNRVLTKNIIRGRDL